MKSKWIIVLAAGLLGAPAWAQNLEFKSELFGGLEWRNIGPAQRGGRSLGACTGSPGRPNEYYFGATGGGLWKTADGGTTWRPVTDGLVDSARRSAPWRLPRRIPDVVYIGDGRGAAPRQHHARQDGVYKTTDGG